MAGIRSRCASFRSPYRKRLLVFLLVLIPAGFATKFYGGPFRTYVNDSLSGVLYVMFWIGVSAYLMPRANRLMIALAVLAATCGLEFLQLWRPPLLEFIRSCFLGRTLIGNSFAWLDIPHYFLGAAAGYWILRLLEPWDCKE